MDLQMKILINYFHHLSLIIILLIFLNHLVIRDSLTPPIILFINFLRL